MSNSRRLRRSIRPAVPEGQPTPVWYGTCQHWTERWDALAGDGVPRCPIDGAPGFHADKTWWPSVDRYEADGHPGYRARVEGMRIGGRFDPPATDRPAPDLSDAPTPPAAPPTPTRPVRPAETPTAAFPGHQEETT